MKMKKNTGKQSLKIDLLALEKNRISDRVMTHSLAGYIGPPTVCGCEHYSGEDETTMQFVR